MKLRADDRQRRFGARGNVLPYVPASAQPVHRGHDRRSLQPDGPGGFRQDPLSLNWSGDGGHRREGHKDSSGGPKGGAIANDAFLALVSDQGLRTIVITGRPELGAPDWRGNTPGRAMSEQDVTDVVAWLASRRVTSPGQPYAVSNPSPQ